MLHLTAAAPGAAPSHVQLHTAHQPPRGGLSAGYHRCRPTPRSPSEPAQRASLGWSVKIQKAAKHTLPVAPTHLQQRTTASLANACETKRRGDAIPGGIHTGTFVAPPMAELARSTPSQPVAHHLGGNNSYHERQRQLFPKTQRCCRAASSGWSHPPDEAVATKPWHRQPKGAHGKTRACHRERAWRGELLQ